MPYHLDYETSSPVDIIKLGAYRYVNDKDARILMFGIARDDGPVKMWVFNDAHSEESMEALGMFQEAIENDELIYAFNAQFELAATRYRGRKDLGLDELPKLENYRCVKAMAQKAAIPANLKGAAEFLNVTHKEASGKALIQIFSVDTNSVALQAPEHLKLYDKSAKGRKMPNRKSFNPIRGWYEEADGRMTQHDEVLWDWSVNVNGEWMTVRAAWDLFIHYCRQDVVVEREVHKKLHKFELLGKSLESFQFNLRLNDRGVPVNIQALKNAQKLVLQYQKRAHVRFRNLTGLGPTQGQKFKAWLQERGYFRDDLQAITVEDFLSEYDDMLDPEAKRALQMYQLLNFAALAKIPAMLNSACDDGYVRGTLLWHGARTGRATGKLIQPQNIKKAKVDTRLAYQMICEGCSLEDFEEFWDSPLEMIASCARHFIQLVDQTFFDADFVGVEARLTPWVVDDDRTLNSILAGEDQYKKQAMPIFGVEYDEVLKWQRTIAKPVVLGCCFGVGGQGLQNGLAGPPYNTRVTLNECKRIVKIYRDDHPETVAAWREIEDAVKLAITDGKTSSVLNGRVKIGRVITAGIRYFVIQLPSGRRLYYPSAEIKERWVAYTAKEMAESEWKRERKGYMRDEIRFLGMRPNNMGWGRIATYGSRLFENIVQAMGADLLDEGCIAATKAGFDIFLIVHDQALCYKHATKTLDDFEHAFCSVGEWADTFPLAADAQEVPYYLKDLD